MKSVCIRQIRVDMPTRRLCMPAGKGINTLTPSGKLLKYGQAKSNVGLLFTKLLNNIKNQEMIS